MLDRADREGADTELRGEFGSWISRYEYRCDLFRLEMWLPLSGLDPNGSWRRRRSGQIGGVPSMGIPRLNPVDRSYVESISICECASGVSRYEYRSDQIGR